MKKLFLTFLSIFIKLNIMLGQIAYNPFVNNIHFSPEPSPLGFECGSVNYISFNQGLTTIADAPYWQTEPLRIRVCISGFTFYGPASTAVTGSYATNFNWEYDSTNSQCVIGTQNQILYGTGNNPLFPNTLSSGSVSIALVANPNSEQGTILYVQTSLEIPPYMVPYNSLPDDVEISQTQSFFQGHTLSSAGNIAGSKIFCIAGDPEGFTSISPATGGPGTNYYYQWQTLIGSTWSDIPGATGLTYDAPPTLSTAYFRRNAKGTLCDNWLSSDTLHVKIDSLPIVGVNAGVHSTLTCASSSMLIGEVPLSGHQYHWSPSIGLSSDTVAQPLASPLVSTIYTLTVIDSNGCVAFDEVHLTVHNIAQPINAGNDKQVNCFIPSIQIGPVAMAGSSYTWSPASFLNNPNIAQPFANPLQTLAYTLTVVDSNGCSATDEVIVHAFSIDSIHGAGQDQFLNCDTTSVSIGSPAVAGYTYLWNPGAGLSSVNVSQPIANPLNTTTYSLSVSDSAGCHYYDEITVYVDNIPPVADAGSDQILDCHNPSATIGMVSSPGDLYSWMPVLYLDNPSHSNPIANPIANTSYTLTVKAPNGCISTDEVLIEVNQDQPQVDANSDGIICIGDSHWIGTDPVVGNDYNWVPGTGLVDRHAAMTSASPSATTTYTLTVTGPNGCEAVDSVTVYVNFCEITISGNVLHDDNGQDNDHIDGIGICRASGDLLYANFVNADKIIIDTKEITPAGTFQFENIPSFHTYSIILSTEQGTLGNQADNPQIPTDWVFTGEDCCDGVGDDGHPDGINTFEVKAFDQTNINFGLRNTSIALPIVLKDFSIRSYDCKALLFFIVSGISNTSIIEVKRKLAGQSQFSSIKRLENFENNAEQKIINFIDSTVEMNETYEYQLKLIDIDGKYTNSGIKIFKPDCDKDPAQFNLYPNPVSGNLQVMYEASDDESALGLNITDLVGKTVMSDIHELHKGLNLLSIDLMKLPPGLYMINYRLKDESNNGSRIFVKQ